MNEYTPVNCNFYDVLTDLAVKRTPVEITYRNDADQPTTAHSTIADVFTAKGGEFLRTADGDVMRLDRIDRVGATKK